MKLENSKRYEIDIEAIEHENHGVLMGINNGKRYEAEIKSIKLELSTLPDGYLIKRGQYYYVNDGTAQKGISRDYQKIKRLARKAYLLKRLENLEYNYLLVKRQYGRCKTEDPAEIIQELSSFYRAFPDSYFFHSSANDLLEKAAKDRGVPEANAGHTDKLVFLTSSGIRVRSKSERTIADSLSRNNIPFRYEAALALGGEYRFPDFTISRQYDGRMVLWEHFGRLDNDEYKKKTIEKLALYARYEFFPSDNLVCTYERDLLNPARIQAIIMMYLF